MTIKFNENRATIESLRRIADAFERREGRISSDELWGEKPIPVSTVREVLRQMEDFLHVLNSLAESYKSHICKVREQVDVQPLTPEDLPDEIILDIFEYDPDVRSVFEYMNSDGRSGRYSGITTLINYSHVCPRFRNRILSRPASQWASIPIGADLHAGTVFFIAHHSGNYGLDMQYHQMGQLSALCVALEYAYRWTNMSIITDDNETTKLKRRFPQVILTTLHSLNVWGRWNSFYLNWTMPTLRECTLGVGGANYGQIIAFLGATPSLTSLTLDLGWLRGSGDGSVRETDSGMANLLNLEHLQIFNAWLFGKDQYGRLIKALCCPSLKSLHFHSTGRPGPRFDLWNPTPLLSELHLDLYGANIAEITSFISSTPALITLRLNLVELKDSADGSALHRADLLMLEIFDYHSRNPERNADQRLLGAVSCPILKRLWLSLSVFEDGHLDYLELSRKMRRWYSSLIFFRLDVIPFDRQRDVMKPLIFFEDLLFSLPYTLEELVIGQLHAQLRSLETPGSYSPAPMHHFQKLKALDIASCDESSIQEVNFYRNIALLLKKSGVVLDRFEVIGENREGAITTFRNAGVLIY